MSTLRLSLCVMSSVFLLAAAPSPESPIRIPDLPSADMRISWDDFKELLHLIQAEDASNKPETVESKPPVPWSLLEAHYEADATQPDFVAIEAVISFHQWSDAWERVPVLGADAALESATLDGEPCFLAQDTNGYALLLASPGAHNLHLKFHVPVTSVEGVVRFEAPVRRTPVTRMTLHLDEPEAVVNAPMAAGTTVRSTDTGMEVDLVFRSADTLMVSWQLPAAPPPDPEPEAKPKVQPRVTCMTTTLATVSENFVSFESALQFEILRGEVSSFSLEVPDTYQVLGVEGKGLSWEASTSDDIQQIRISLNHVIQDRYALTIRYESPIEETASAIDLHPLNVADVLRHKGYVAVASSGNVELGIEPQLEEIQRVDVSDLPTTLVQRSFHPILHGFQYQAAEYLLALDFHRLEHVPVRVAGIDDARLTTVRTEAGMTINKIAYTVRNHHKKFLRVEIGADAKVWSAQVAGATVRPARNDDETAVLIPLRKSATLAVDGGGFPVELVYAMEGPPREGWRTTLQFEAPRSDLLANRFAWDIWIPEQHAVYQSTGDLEANAGIDGPLSLLANNVRSAERYDEQTIYRMREGIERFFITDINNPAASAHARAGHETAYDGALDLAYMEQQSDVQVAGVVPIAMDVPITGRAYRFQRTVVPENTPVAITIEAVDRRLITLAGALLRTLGLLLGVVVVWRIMQHLNERRLRRYEGLLLVVCVLILIGAFSLWGYEVVEYLRWPMVGIAIGALMSLGKWLSTHPDWFRHIHARAAAGEKA